MERDEFLNRCNAIVEEGRDILELDTGIVSRVENNGYTIVAVSDKPRVFVPGETFSLSQTYCQDVINQKRTIHLTNNSTTASISSHPLYKNMPLQAYISTPILVDNHSWGTLNFSSMISARQGFDLSEIDYLQERSRIIARYVEELAAAYSC